MPTVLSTVRIKYYIRANKGELNMTKLRLLLVFSVAVVFLAFLVFTWNPSFSQESRKTVATGNAKPDEIISFVQAKKILNVFYWEQEVEEPYLCITSRESSTKDNETTVIFKIYNNEGQIVYQQDLTGAGEIRRIYSVYALRNGRPQLAVEMRLGGTDRFLYLFDNRDGHLVNLIPSYYSDFNWTCEIKPQFRGALEDIRKLPFQIYLTSQIGSISAPETTILSLKDNRYVYERTVETSKLEAISPKK